MTDLEINKALALTIGWKPEQIIEYEGQDYIGLPVVILRPAIKLFSYKFWNVIGPIAAKLIVELIKCKSYHIEYWQAIHGMEDDLDHAVATADTPQKAIALAVIQGAKT